MDLDLRGAYIILNKISEWGCLINYGFNTFSEKVNHLQNLIRNINHSNQNNQIDERFNCFEVTTTQLCNNFQLCMNKNSELKHWTGFFKNKLEVYQ